MRIDLAKTILAVGRRFGRFAVLLLLPPVAIIMTLWFSLMEEHLGWFLASAFVVLPIVMITIAFLVGMLFAGFWRKKIRGVSRSEAPGLWSAWESVAGSAVARKTTIVLDDRPNASVAVERTLLGFGQHYILDVGIPLLAVTDKQAMFAILKHENGHLLNKDVNGSLRLAELDRTFDFVFDFAPPDSSISGRLLFTLLGGLSQSFERETMRLSRDAEIKADRQAVSGGRAEDAAQALLLLSASIEFLEETVYEPLRHELMGAMSPPTPPLKRVSAAAVKLHDAELLNSYAQKAWAAPVDEHSSHPSCAQRLSALGYEECFPIKPVATSALALLEDGFAQRTIAALDEAWTNRVADQLQW